MSTTKGYNGRDHNKKRVISFTEPTYGLACNRGIDYLAMWLNVQKKNASIILPIMHMRT